jgi:hypothetical protein
MNPDDFSRLHPDGAPGEGESAMRRMMGDRNYEALRDATKKQNDLTLDHSAAHTALIKAQAALLGAVTFALSIGTLLAIGWSVWRWW